MAGDGKICYKPNDGRLAFKSGGNGSLVFKMTPGDWTEVSFAWGSDGDDLDIWAYWEGAPNMCAGFRKGSEPQSIPSKTYSKEGAYNLWWSGDDTSVEGSELLKVKMTPWQNGGSRRLIVKLNFFGYDSERHPGSTCTVIASQVGGETKVKRGVNCGTASGESAVSSSSSVMISFDEHGKLIGIN